MKVLKKVLIASVSALFGLSLFACGKEELPSDSNLSTPTSSSVVESTTSTPSNTSSSDTSSSSEAPHEHAYVADTTTFKDGFEWSADHATAKLHVVCSDVATHKDTVDAIVSSNVTQEVSCTDPEVTTYTATAKVNGADVTSTPVTVDTKAALGHAWTVDSDAKYVNGFEWAADGSTAKLHLVCEHDGTHTHVVDAVVTHSITTAQSCTVKEVTTYTATATWADYNNGTAVTSTKDIETKDVLGHSYIVDTSTYADGFEWSADHTTATLHVVCEHDANHKDTVVATVSSTVDTVQSCTDAEVTTFNATAKLNGADVNATPVTATTKEALGHSITYHPAVDPTCEDTGVAEYWECDRCVKLFVNEDFTETVDDETALVIKAKGHTTTSVSKVNATCLTDGMSSHYECTDCHKLFSDRNATDEVLESELVIKALGHDYTETVIIDATCEHTGLNQYACSRTGCNDTYTKVISKKDHSSDTLQYVGPSKPCQTPYVLAYFYQCPYCKKMFKNSYGSNEITEEEKSKYISETTEAHDIVSVPYKAATCAEEGNYSHYKCSKCNELFSDNRGTTPTTEEKVTIAKRTTHTWGPTTETKPATCTTPGVSTKECSVCKTTQTDFIPATGHDYKEDTDKAIEATCTATGSKTYTCSHDGCGDTYTEVVPAKGHTWVKDTEHSTAPTCEDTGVDKYTCSVQDCGVEKEEVVPATGHTWVKDTEHSTAPTCEDTGIDRFTCSVQDCTATKEEVVEALGHDLYDEGYVTKAPTCEEPGTIVYICKRDESHEVEEVLEALGHDYDDGVVTLAPTCETEGTMTFTCANDSEHTYTEVIPATGHLHLVKHTPVEATCSTDGVAVTYWTCEDCNKMFSDRKGTFEITEANIAEFVIPATNEHTLTLNEARAADCESTGYDTHYSCDVCHKLFADENGDEELDAANVITPALGHKVEMWTNVEDFVLGGMATISGYCTVCHEIGTMLVPAPESAKMAPTSKSDYNTFFDVKTDSTPYTFTYNSSTKSWNSNNQGVDSSKAAILFTAKYDMTVSLSYYVESERKDWDKLNISAPKSPSSGNLGGDATTGTYTATLAKGDALTIEYIKDSSGSDGFDGAKIFNMVVSPKGLAESDYKSYKNSIRLVVATIVSTNADGDEVGTPVVVEVGTPVADLAEVAHFGKLFRGWYSDAKFETSIAKGTINANGTVIYAKMVDALAVTTHYDNGVQDDDVNYLAAGEEVRVPKDPTIPAGKVFLGWYTTPTFEAESAFTEASKISEPLDLYARYIDAPSWVGRYYGDRVDFSTTMSLGSVTTVNASNYASSNYGINNKLGLATSYSSNYTIDYTTYDEKTHEATLMKDGKAAGTIFLYPDRKMLIVAQYPSADDKVVSGFNFVYITMDVPSIELRKFNLTENETIVSLSYGKGRFNTTEMIYMNAETDTILFDVKLFDIDDKEMALKDVCNADKVYAERLVVKAADDTVLATYGYKDGKYGSLDAVAGTYTGPLGSVRLNGVGTALVTAEDADPKSVHYTIIDDATISFNLDNRYRILALDAEAMTYTLKTDATKDKTYNGDYGAFVSNGDGTGKLADADVVYAMSGNSLTLTYVDPELGDAKTILISDDGTYVTRSIFSGLHFSGTFEFSYGPDQVHIYFDEDSGEISGTIYFTCDAPRTGYNKIYLGFTGEIEENTLVITCTEQQYLSSSFVGGVTTLTISDGSLTFNDSYSQYHVKGVTITCSDFHF